MILIDFNVLACSWLQQIFINAAPAQSETSMERMKLSLPLSSGTDAEIRFILARLTAQDNFIFCDVTP
jgi:hypothetical protein